MEYFCLFVCLFVSLFLSFLSPLAFKYGFDRLITVRCIPAMQLQYSVASSLLLASPLLPKEAAQRMRRPSGVSFGRLNFQLKEEYTVVVAMPVPVRAGYPIWRLGSMLYDSSCFSTLIHLSFSRSLSSSFLTFFVVGSIVCSRQEPLLETPICFHHYNNLNKQRRST